MAENQYSENVKKAIVNFANSCGGKYLSVREEGKIWLKAPHTATSFYQFPYKPEVRLTKKNKNAESHTIIEIVDSQLKDPNLIIADIIQALLVDGATKIIFIAPTDEGQEKIKELSQTIPAILMKRLVDSIKPYANENTMKKIAKKYSFPGIIIYKISNSEAMNPVILKKLIHKWFKNDNW